MAQVRSCPRIHAGFPIIFSGDQFVGEGTVVNLSVPGCAIQSKRRVEAGTYLELRILVPDQQAPLSVGLARVRWTHGRSFGVEFIRMPGRDQVRLGRLVKYLPFQPPIDRSHQWKVAHASNTHFSDPQR
jgi:hypothetical protein